MLVLSSRYMLVYLLDLKDSQVEDFHKLLPCYTIGLNNILVGSESRCSGHMSEKVEALRAR